jgi:orotate phosphoribosyltransferase
MFEKISHKVSMNIEEEVLAILKRTGAVITDSHIVGTSGRHMAIYINKDAIYPHTLETFNLCRLFAEKVKAFDVDVVVGPVIGGVILSQLVAYHLSSMKNKDILGLYAEKTPEGGMTLISRRNYHKLVAGKKVLVVEDITNTGGSAQKTVEAVKEVGGSVIAVAAIANRNPETVTAEFLGAPFYPLCIFKAENFSEEECPLCKTGVPINIEVGHGKKYLEEKSKKLA